MKKLTLFLKNQYFLATAVLMFLSFPSYDFILFKFFFIFAWFSLVPLFTYVSGKPLKDVFFTTFITGLLGNLFAYGWEFRRESPGWIFRRSTLFNPEFDCVFFNKSCYFRIPDAKVSAV